MMPLGPGICCNEDCSLPYPWSSSPDLSLLSCLSPQYSVFTNCAHHVLCFSLFICCHVLAIDPGIQLKVDGELYAVDSDDLLLNLIPNGSKVCRQHVMPPQTFVQPRSDERYRGLAQQHSMTFHSSNYSSMNQVVEKTRCVVVRVGH